MTPTIFKHQNPFIIEKKNCKYHILIVTLTGYDLRTDVKELTLYFNTSTVYLLLFCRITNHCTINRQMTILLLHVSTLLCHSQEARSYLHEWVLISP
jgi:hypothetical protein